MTAKHSNLFNFFDSLETPAKKPATSSGNQEELVKIKGMASRYCSTGRIAFVYPKLRTVSFDGGRPMNFKDAIAYSEKIFKLLEDGLI